jgi:hypothetical protein
MDLVDDACLGIWNVESEIERATLEEEETHELVAKGDLDLDRREEWAL